MKIPRFIPKKKLQKFQATARRLPRAPVMSEEDEEPTIKLSNAVIVVLLLHVVAIGGIWAFMSIKAHKEGSFLPPLPEKPAALPVGEAAPVASDAIPTPKAAAIKPPTPAHVAELPVKKPAEPLVKPKPFIKDSGEYYTVAKGDNPVAIARKLKVNYDEFLKLNKIDDPKKLQVGQRLHVPTKKTN